MLFRNHLVVTLSVAIVSVGYMADTISPIVAVGCIFLGSILPDLDHPGSTIGKRLKFISLPLSVFLGHRQITHSIWPFVIAYGFGLPANPALMAFMLGYASHLIADIVTDSGIPLFWPLQTRIRLPLSIETGGVIEYLVAYSLLFFCIFK